MNRLTIAMFVHLVCECIGHGHVLGGGGGLMAVMCVHVLSDCRHILRFHCLSVPLQVYCYGCWVCAMAKSIQRAISISAQSMQSNQVSISFDSNLCWCLCLAVAGMRHCCDYCLWQLLQRPSTEAGAKATIRLH